MSFKEYHSIENHYRNVFIDKIKKIDTGKWCATEKCDGSNVSFIMSISPTDNKLQIQRASRNHMLAPTEGFFQLPNIQKQYQSNLEKLFELVKIIYNPEDMNNFTVRLYGELYGGHYPTKTKGVSAVQKSVYYSPDINFIAFDLMVNDDYMNYHKVIELLKLCDLPYSPILHEGTLEELLKLNPVFTSTIPTLLGNDTSVDVGENLSEGYVLKPLESMFMKCDEEGDDLQRVIIKLKNDRFTEVNTKATVTIPKEQLVAELSEEVQTYAINCINENRYNSVISKMTDDERKTRGKIIQAMIQDVVKDVVKEHNIDNNTKLMLNGVLGKKVNELVSKLFN